MNDLLAAVDQDTFSVAFIHQWLKKTHTDICDQNNNLKWLGNVFPYDRFPTLIGSH